jgi:hypothetical protein
MGKNMVSQRWRKWEVSCGKSPEKHEKTLNEVKK